MTEYKEVIYDVETGETVERSFTQEEITIAKADQSAAAAKATAEATELNARETAKAKLLERLGITADEAALLLG